MNLDDAQRKQVAAWIAQGLKLSEIQNRLASDLGVRLTYMEVRLLVDDLKLTPKDAEPVKPVAVNLGGPTSQPATAAPGLTPAPAPAQPAGAPAGAPIGGVSVTVDQLARPGALVSGKVTFSDGNTADWYLDQTGRLGLSPKIPGYRPNPADVQEFQVALESELSKVGF